MIKVHLFPIGIDLGDFEVFGVEFDDVFLWLASDNRRGIDALGGLVDIER